jgi:hypothetical protein
MLVGRRLAISALDSAVGGAGGVVLLAGETGMGKTVTARIRDAIARIEHAHPELGRHLRASIVTGARCAYRPAETVRWTISQS